MQQRWQSEPAPPALQLAGLTELTHGSTTRLGLYCLIDIASTPYSIATPRAPTETASRDGKAATYHRRRCSLLNYFETRLVVAGLEADNNGFSEIL